VRPSDLPPNIDQAKIIAQMIIFMEHETNQKLVMFKNPPAIGNQWMGFGDCRLLGIEAVGACLGFATTHSYMATTKNTAWWLQVLQAISRWNGQKDSLNDTPLPNNNETLYSLMRRAINYVIFHLTIAPIELSFESRQYSHLTVLTKDFFECEYGTAEDGFEIACNMESCLEQILGSDEFRALFNQPIVMIIQSASEAHACTLRISEQNWYFYDPNNTQGEIQHTLTSLVESIKSTLGTQLAINFTSWVKIEALDSFKQFYFELLTRDYSKLMEGAEIIQQYAPSQSSHLPQIAAAQPNKTFSDNRLLIRLIMLHDITPCITLSNLPLKNLLKGICHLTFIRETRLSNIVQNFTFLCYIGFYAYNTLAISNSYVQKKLWGCLGAMILLIMSIPLLVCAGLKCYAACHKNSIFSEKNRGNNESTRLLPEENNTTVVRVPGK